MLASDFASGFDGGALRREERHCWSVRYRFIDRRCGHSFNSDYVRGRLQNFCDCLLWRITGLCGWVSRCSRGARYGLNHLFLGGASGVPSARASYLMMCSALSSKAHGPGHKSMPPYVSIPGSAIMLPCHISKAFPPGAKLIIRCLNALPTIEAAGE